MSEPLIGEQFPPNSEKEPVEQARLIGSPGYVSEPELNAATREGFKSRKTS
jgi:hypothetical protein